MFVGQIMAQYPGMTYEQALGAAKQQVDVLVNQELIPGTGFTLNDLITDALLQHYAGDEKPDAMKLQIIAGMMASDDEITKMLGGALYDLYNDPTPDRNFEIDLKSLTK